MDKKEAKRILSDAKAVLTQYIESRGLRKTQERYAILEAVYGFNEPFSIEDLSNALMEKCQVTLPTLYRTLDLFITLGLVIRHTQKDVQHYEKCYGEKGFFQMVCVHCGKTIPFKSAALVEALRDSKYPRFRPVNATVCVYGSCAACNSRLAREQKKIERQRLLQEKKSQQLKAERLKRQLENQRKRREEAKKKDL
ncbi:MAG: transcriptional repressor [Bacteroidaceae bacterium]|jgi:Fur family ferric uptake transcriptional regulator|nr:transcriptional repressor [Bacteroidaceae bacterium]MBQ2200357.1 transcriptional repressor [Bacteroidaceae bacterium]MBQ2585709.1 transcriptional repressor [Bacteroidaceae bacterium]MBQ3628099.1 transcriptional repressor [Bacteroidaceae bacterium]